jgi:membrane protease YdiL (CAAX protease family)
LLPTEIKELGTVLTILKHEVPALSPYFWEAAVGAALIPMNILASTLLTRVIRFLEGPLEEDYDPSETLPENVVLASALLTFYAFIEELICRIFALLLVYESYRIAYPDSDYAVTTAIWLSSLFWGALHWFNRKSWGDVARTSLKGLLYGCVFALTFSLIPVTVMHAANNITCLIWLRNKRHHPVVPPSPA